MWLGSMRNRGRKQKCHVSLEPGVEEILDAVADRMGEDPLYPIPTRSGRRQLLRQCPRLKMQGRLLTLPRNSGPSISSRRSPTILGRSPAPYTAWPPRQRCACSSNTAPKMIERSHWSISRLSLRPSAVGSHHRAAAQWRQLRKWRAFRQKTPVPDLLPVQSGRGARSGLRSCAPARCVDLGYRRRGAGCRGCRRHGRGASGLRACQLRSRRVTPCAARVATR